MDTQNSARKSFVGGFIGGLLGYLLGSIINDAFISVLAFFAFGYIGYDMRNVVETTRTHTAGTLRNMQSDIATRARWMWENFPLGVVCLPVFLIATAIQLATWSNGYATVGLGEWYQNVPHLLFIEVRWLFTGYEPYRGTDTTPFLIRLLAMVSCLLPSIAIGGLA